MNFSKEFLWTLAVILIASLIISLGLLSLLSCILPGNFTATRAAIAGAVFFVGSLVGLSAYAVNYIVKHESDRQNWNDYKNDRY